MAPAIYLSQKYLESEILRQKSECQHQIPVPIQNSFASYCPSCSIAADLKAIRTCQDAIVRRGGIFKSKDLAVALPLPITTRYKGSNLEPSEARLPTEDTIVIGHREWLKCWRRVKIGLLRDLDLIMDLLKMLQHKDSSMQDARTVLSEALNIYEEKKEELMEVPGWTPPVTQADQEPQENQCGEEFSGQDSANQGDRSAKVNAHSLPSVENDLKALGLSDSRSAPSTPKSTARRVQFSQIVTVSPDVFSPSSKPTEQLHNLHTVAEFASDRKTWSRRRRSGGHRRTWSSPQGYEKLETSWFRKSFEKMEHDFNTMSHLDEVDLDRSDVKTVVASDGNIVSDARERAEASQEAGSGR